MCIICGHVQLTTTDDSQFRLWYEISSEIGSVVGVCDGLRAVSSTRLALAKVDVDRGPRPNHRVVVSSRVDLDVDLDFIRYARFDPKSSKFVYPLVLN